MHSRTPHEPFGRDLCTGYICAFTRQRGQPRPAKGLPCSTQPWRRKPWIMRIPWHGGSNPNCTFCRSSWSTLLWMLAPHLDIGPIWMSHGEVGWLVGHNKCQKRRGKQPFPSLPQLEPEIYFHYCWAVECDGWTYCWQCLPCLQNLERRVAFTRGNAFM